MPKPTAAANAAPMPASSRRAFLKAGAALGSVAALAVPVAVLPKAEACTLTSPSDPVFAAIAEFRAKRVAFNAALKEQAEYETRCTARGVSFCAPSPESDEIEGRCNAASDADTDAWWAFLNTTPTTRAGLLAYLDMLTDYDGYAGGRDADDAAIGAICGAVRGFVTGGDHA